MVFWVSTADFGFSAGRRKVSDIFLRCLSRKSGSQHQLRIKTLPSCLGEPSIRYLVTGGGLYQGHCQSLATHGGKHGLQGAQLGAFRFFFFVRGWGKGGGVLAGGWGMWWDAPMGPDGAGSVSVRMCKFPSSQALCNARWSFPLGLCECRVDLAWIFLFENRFTESTISGLCHWKFLARNVKLASLGFLMCKYGHPIAAT